MNIRLAEAAEIGDLVEFNQAMALETEGKQLVPEVLTAGVSASFEDAQKGFYVVAESDSRIVGGLMVTYEWSDWRNKWVWWIQSVYVRPEFRGQRVYSKLYEFVKTRAIEADAFGIRLYVENDNYHAQKVYEKVGMEPSHYVMYEEML